MNFFATKALLGALFAIAGTAGTVKAAASQQQVQEVTMESVRYHSAQVDGVKIFYREAGEASKPALVLLHGFPSSSHMFRDLIPALAHDFHIIAPDYPGFGYSDMPSPVEFEYSFDHLAAVTGKFLEQIGTTHFYVYMQDYGGPIGFRLAVQHPDWIRGLIIQNANAYAEGVSPLLESLLKPIWQKRNAKTEAQILKMFELENTKFQYQTGTRNKDAMNPDAWTHDQALLDRPGSKLIQLELQATYDTNLKHYDEWHRYFRERQPPTLIVWGKGDPIFTEQGARAYQKDLKNVDLHLFNTGHFALEEEAPAIAQLIKNFGARTNKL